MEKNENWKPNIIVLGPGGAKAYLELGALLKLEKDGYIDGIEHWIGCSAGAAIALLIVAGYKISEIIEETLKIDLLQDLMDIGSLKEIIDNKGLFSNKNLEHRLRKKIIDKFGFELTLHQLYMATGIKLTIVVYNMNKERPEYFSKDTEPHLSCIKAIMMSVSVPLIMQRRLYKGYEYVDGALGNPYPIDIHDNGQNKILGLYVVTEHNSSNNPFSFIYRVLHASLNQYRQKIISSASKHCRHIRLSAPVYDTTGLTLTDEDKKTLLREGFNRAVKFIEESKNPNKHRILLPENDEIPFDDTDLDDIQDIDDTKDTMDITDTKDIKQSNNQPNLIDFSTSPELFKIPINKQSTELISTLEKLNYTSN